MTSGGHLFEYLGLHNSVKFAHMQMLRKEYNDFFGLVECSSDGLLVSRVACDHHLKCLNNLECLY